ncbi:hypothetical protein D0C36_21485 [Mucilaginibacter conchicola]|uniref:PH domain-containing protein n=1 Tax=Mucilaginibacter conchicola TaxID=2303333 RepID=A0A372NP19_9SPHI|nr:STM3941 family protein [Mucilaginibacter conchicola]RFZ90367.1 hypothetical protein D0C36_21485 [Mucilaginibacter conchicola]
MKPHNPLDIIEIPLSKTSMALGLAASAVFVAAGIWFVNHPNQFHRAPLIITIIGIAAIVAFGVAALYIVNKLFDTRPGFIIDDDGITDNSNAFAVGFVPWEDVQKIEVAYIQRQKIIKIYVKDPDGYIRRQPNALSRRMASISYRIHGSPVAVSAQALQSSFDDLYKLITERRPNL